MERAMETVKGLSDEKIRELAREHLDYVSYDEGEYGCEIEITGELDFYDAIVNELNKQAKEKE